MAKEPPKPCWRRSRRARSRAARSAAHPRADTDRGAGRGARRRRPHERRDRRRGRAEPERRRVAPLADLPEAGHRRAQPTPEAAAGCPGRRWSRRRGAQRRKERTMNALSMRTLALLSALVAGLAIASGLAGAAARGHGPHGTVYVTERTLGSVTAYD